MIESQFEKEDYIENIIPSSPINMLSVDESNNGEKYNSIEYDFSDYKYKNCNYQELVKTKAITNEMKDGKNVIINNDYNLNLNHIFNENKKISKEEIEEINSNNLNKEKKKCGRKRKRENEINNEHNKFSDDNIRRKCKHMIIKNLLKFINLKISKLYNGKIGHGVFKKELKTLNQAQISDASVNFNKNFLNKSLCDIFSENISGRFTLIPQNFNQNLIEKLKNEEDEDKKTYFNKLFSLTFYDALRHFRGEIKISELEGLECFNEEKNKILSKYDEDGEDYVPIINFYLKNFEVIINNKRSRSKRNKE